MASIVLALIGLVLAAPAAQAESWRRPVDGRELRAFVVGGDRYARGQHRGVDFAAPSGARVRSACSGRVAFAGRVPRGGGTVSVRCGRLVATYLQLASIAVRRGEHLAAGAALGTVGRSHDPYERRPHLHLGARVAATGRHLDPLSLLRGVHPAPPLLPVGRVRPHPLPLARAPVPALGRPDPPRRLPAPVVPRALALGFAASLAGPWRRPTTPSLRTSDFPSAASPAFSAPPPRAGGPGIPWIVWAGLVGITAALQLGGLVRRRRHLRRRPTSAARTA